MATVWRTVLKGCLAFLTVFAGHGVESEVCHAQQISSKRLPPRAILHLGRLYDREKTSSAQEECRRIRSVTLADVRHRFATWIEVTGMQYDLGAYVSLECGRRGTVTVDGKSYTWSIHPQDTLMTDWPDGQTHWYVRRLLSPKE